MKLRRSSLACGVLSFLLFLAFASPCFAKTAFSDRRKALTQPRPISQSRDVTDERTSAELKPGIVVESIAKNSAAQKAGLVEGDILLSWSRSDDAGKFDSPFDLFTVGIEQLRSGAVKIEGIRGRKRRTWVLGATDNWTGGIEARPNLSQSLLSAYLEGQQLTKLG